MSRRRILVLTSTLPSRRDDGTPAFVSDLSIELGADFDVRIIAPATPGAPRRERLSEHVDVIRYRFFPRRWEDVADGAILENIRSKRSRLVQVPFLLVGLATEIRRQIARFRPDALHVHWIIPQGIVARRVARRLPTVVTTLGGDLYALDSRFSNALKGDVLRSADAVTVMNSDMLERAIALGARRTTSHVMPMGTRLRVSPHQAGDVPDGDSGPGRPVRLLAVGRLVEKKGFDVLLRSLRDVDFAYELEIVGGGPEREKLAELARGMPVTFVGQRSRSELADHYHRADIAVFPSRRASSGDQDGLPVAMLEAMSAGCAIVATDLPGLNEAVTDGESGLLVGESDEAALSSALRSLATDAERRAQLGAAARARAESYTMESVGTGYRELFHGLLGDAPTTNR